MITNREFYWGGVVFTEKFEIAIYEKIFNNHQKVAAVDLFAIFNHVLLVPVKNLVTYFFALTGFCFRLLFFVVCRLVEY